MRAPSAVAVALLVAALLAGCTRQDPEVTLEDQVPAEMREGEEPAGGAPEDGEPGEAATTLTFVAVDIDYREAPESAPAGELVVEIVNEGNLPHNVVFEGVMGDQAIAEAQGGETATGPVQLDAGSYTYYCSVPGHREAGMEGDVDIE